MNINNEELKITRYDKQFESKDIQTKDEKDKIVSITKPILDTLFVTQNHIIPRLEELIKAAHPVDIDETGLNKSLALKKIDDCRDILQKLLSQDVDIRDRLNEIASQTFHTPQQQCRQLQDMELYLILLSRHAKVKPHSLDEEKKLDALVKEVRNTLNYFNETLLPEWSTHLEDIKAIIEKELPKKGAIPQGQSQLNIYSEDRLDNKIFAHVLLESMIKGTSTLFQKCFC